MKNIIIIVIVVNLALLVGYVLLKKQTIFTPKTPKQLCEQKGGVWNFTFPPNPGEPGYDPKRPQYICDPKGTVRFGRQGGNFYGSDGSKYEAGTKEIVNNP